MHIWSAVRSCHTTHHLRCSRIYTLWYYLLLQSIYYMACRFRYVNRLHFKTFIVLLVSCIAEYDDDNKHYLSQQQRGNKIYHFFVTVLVCPSMSLRCHNKKYHKMLQVCPNFITCLHSNNRYFTHSIFGVRYFTSRRKMKM